MDPRTSAQDVMRCDLCETAAIQMHCNICLVNMCKACVGEHFSVDLSKPHKIVDFKDGSTLIYPRCTSHNKKKCEMYCTQCDIPVCSNCLASDHHLGHKLVKILEVRAEKISKIVKEQTELNKTIYPTYQTIASDVQNRLSQLEKEYEDLSTAITKHGEDWHREIDKIIEKLKDDVNETKKSQLATLQKHLDEIHKKMSNIKDEINSIDIALDATDILSMLNVHSRVDEYRKLPSKIILSLPNFSPKKLMADQLFSLTFIPLKSDEHGYIMKTTQKSAEAGSSPPVKQLLHIPKTVTTIHTGYPRLYNVACVSDKEIWTSGLESTMKLFSINDGTLLKSITTKSGNWPHDIAVTQSGDLVYTDYSERTVNIVKKRKIEKVIRLWDWRPHGVCSTSSGELLVMMDNDANRQSKVVRYHGSTEKQTIQFDDKGKPLYSFVESVDKCISENRNLDICVSDEGAGAVVVVNQAGELRFRYTGHTPAPKNKQFSPRGIATSSHSHILITDENNDCVHIIDQDGQFIRYVDYGLSNPEGQCTDTNDNMFVAQWRNSHVKKIKCYK